MLNSAQYNLATINFTGGESVALSFDIVDADGTPHDCTGETVTFSITEYLDKFGVPVIIKEATLSVGASGVKNVASVVLPALETNGMFGEYIYQILVEDAFGNIEVPGQGIAEVRRNINGNGEIGSPSGGPPIEIEIISNAEIDTLF